jgi:hypothetical protein
MQHSKWKLLSKLKLCTSVLQSKSIESACFINPGQINFRLQNFAKKRRSSLNLANPRHCCSNSIFSRS